MALLGCFETPGDVTERALGTEAPGRRNECIDAHGLGRGVRRVVTYPPTWAAALRTPGGVGVCAIDVYMYVLHCSNASPSERARTDKMPGEVTEPALGTGATSPKGPTLCGSCGL